MTEVRCTVCGETAVLSSRLALEGDCEKCGEVGTLQELDAYDDPDIRELRCAECGWTVEAGIDVSWDEDERQIFTVDDDCPLCTMAGYPGHTLEPVDQVRSVRELPEYAGACAAARKLRAEHETETVPVDVAVIAAAVGLRVERGPFRHDGLLRDGVIEVPQGHQGAERFVVAHELGHHCLAHQGDRQKIEPEANAFASELLIPRDALRKELRTPQTLSSLARRFDVSRQAIFYAVQAARLIDRLAR
jgi:phage FluMu protein Com